MSRWFRFYDDAVNDPKVQRMSGEKFKAWVNLLCLASKNDGVLPALADIAFTMRISEDKVSALLNEFCASGLLDPVEVDGAPMSYEPHNWGGRQFKSDVSNERVKRYRQRKRNVTPAVTVTPPDTEQKQITEQSTSVAKATGASLPAMGVVSEADVYRIGKDLLGRSSGGVITALRKHCRQDLREVRDLLEQSRDKAAPMEWLQGVLRGTESARMPLHQVFPDDVYRNVL